MKKIISFLLVICMFLSFSITSFADGDYNIPCDESNNIEENSVEPRAEECEWVFRVYNGNVEMRLWSNTYGVWRTDWIIVGPYPGN